MSVFLNYKKSPIQRGESSYKQYRQIRLAKKEFVRKKRRLVQVSKFRRCLVGRVEKWEDEKLWEDGKLGVQKSFDFPSCVFGWRGGKVRGWCGDQLPLQVLFKMDRLGLWPNDPVRGRGHVRERLTKVEMKVTLQEELKGIYSSPKPIRGNLPPWDLCSRWLETSQPS